MYVQEKMFMRPTFVVKREFYKQLDSEDKLLLKDMLNDNGIDKVLIVGNDKRQYTIKTQIGIKKGRK